MAHWYHKLVALQVYENILFPRKMATIQNTYHPWPTTVHFCQTSTCHCQSALVFKTSNNSWHCNSSWKFCNVPPLSSCVLPAKVFHILVNHIIIHLIFQKISLDLLVASFSSYTTYNLWKVTVWILFIPSTNFTPIQAILNHT